MRVMVFGAGGLLGRALTAECCAAGDRVASITRAECDVADEAGVERAVQGFLPAFIFNAAAMTDVDGAERAPEAAWRANAEGPAVLARAASRAGARLVHVSTDYVFDGEKGAPYVETDRPSPRGVYARSKLEGERAALAAQSWAVVARTSWLYGPGGKSFVAKIPEILRRKGEVAAVSDQSSAPTRADELARLLRVLAREAAGGVYHAGAAGVGSYFEVALEAAKALGVPASKVTPQPGAALGRPAPRPRMSALASTALPAQGIAPLRDWRESYREFAASFA
jgi:dTDP-4-dehydrorhamnose reductase